MDITKYEMGPLGTNTYFLSDNNDVILIDPAGKPEKVIELLNDKNLLAVLLTHGHFDHIKAVDGLYDKYHMPVYLNENDEELARDKHQGADFNIYNYITCKTVNAKDSKQTIGNFNFQIVHTPGHTEGSVIYVFDDVIFTGDTLFKESVGRTDLKGGDNRKLVSSLKVFKSFKEETVIYPGHGDITTLEHEFKYNPYM